MQRRQFVSHALFGLAGAALLRPAAAATQAAPSAAPAVKVDKLVKTEDEWRKLLTPEQFRVLREAGTERPFSSPLNNEKRKGTFVCAGCDLTLFESKTKFDSGTGWPSFYQCIEGHVEASAGQSIMFGTEYHCARCGGHHGHIFADGPKPTGLRYCENGVAIKFIAA
jgi:peptide-methionine (R)-S-oxide reductase